MWLANNILMPGLPLVMHCRGDGMVAFQCGHRFHPILDHPESSVAAIISEEDIFIDSDTVIEYGMFYPYKEMPKLLAWLKAQGLQKPF